MTFVYLPWYWQWSIICIGWKDIWIFTNYALWVKFLNIVSLLQFLSFITWYYNLNHFSFFEVGYLLFEVIPNQFAFCIYDNYELIFTIYAIYSVLYEKLRVSQSLRLINNTLAFILANIGNYNNIKIIIL